MLSSECYFEESIPIPKIDLNEDLPTVMLLGQTGAGKSYFGNALLGYVDPSKGIFRTRNSHGSTNSIPSFNSVTAGINAQTGSFFQNNVQRYLPVEHFRLNVVDTPGWGDTDPTKRSINAQRIAQSLQFGVNLFFFIKSSKWERFSEVEQEILGDLHNWTNGDFWKHLG